jgi:hypothetical protein
MPKNGRWVFPLPATHETFRTRTAKTKIQRESHEVAVSRVPSPVQEKSPS